MRPLHASRGSDADVKDFDALPFVCIPSYAGRNESKYFVCIITLLSAGFLHKWVGAREAQLRPGGFELRFLPCSFAQPLAYKLYATGTKYAKYRHA